MKMDRQNPGGHDTSDRTMKGSERFQARGKGDLQTGYAPGQMKKFDSSAEGSLGASKAGHVRTYQHALTSCSGSTVTGSSKAAK